MTDVVERRRRKRSSGTRMLSGQRSCFSVLFITTCRELCCRCSRDRVSLATSFAIISVCSLASFSTSPIVTIIACRNVPFVCRTARRSLGKAMACPERVEAVSMFRCLCLSTAERISTWPIRETNGWSCGSPLPRQERSSLVGMTIRARSNGLASVLLDQATARTSDPVGNTSVADMFNDRIVMFRRGQVNDTIRAGVSGRLATNVSLLDSPEGVVFAQQLNLDGSDSLNHRVPKFLSY